VNEQPDGFYVTAFDDTHAHPAILSFNPFGVGSVSYPNNQPRLVVDMKGATLYREDGTIERAGLWETPRWYKDDPDAPSIVKPAYLRLNERLALDFHDRVNNELVFFCDGEYKYWCGQRLKRKDGTYLDNHNGKYVYGEMAGLYKVDMPATIYERSEAIAAAAGQKFSISDTLPGLKDIADSCTKQAHYVETTETMKIQPHLTPSDMQKAYATIHPEPLGGGSRSVDRFYAEKMLASNLKKAAEVKRANLTLEAGRRRLPAITRRYYDEVLQLCSDNKQLLMVCALGSWSKESTDMEKALEEVNATLWKIFEDKSSDPKKVAPALRGTALDGGLNLPYRLVRYDPTKEHLLRDRYKVDSVPMFVFYYNKQLLGLNRRWNGYGQTRNDLLAELRKQHENGERGRFLPEDYVVTPAGLMQ